MQVWGSNFVEVTFQVLHLKFIASAEGCNEQPIDLLVTRRIGKSFWAYKAYLGAHILSSLVWILIDLMFGLQVRRLTFSSSFFIS